MGEKHKPRVDEEGLHRADEVAAADSLPLAEVLGNVDGAAVDRLQGRDLPFVARNKVQAFPHNTNKSRKPTRLDGNKPNKSLD